MDDTTFSKLPEPTWAEGGNVLAIDHANGEFSVLCHMRQGRVRVKAEDKVRAGPGSRATKELGQLELPPFALPASERAAVQPVRLATV